MDESSENLEFDSSSVDEDGLRPAILSSIHTSTEHTHRLEHLQRQSAYAEALAQCSRALLAVRDGETSQQSILNQALEPLRVAAQACRAYLFENFHDPDGGFCSGIRAEVRARNVSSNLVNPASQKIPWSALPARNRRLLANGRSVGGPIEDTFADKPEMIAWLQRLGISSVLFLPIKVGDVWWGYVGFDDCEAPREWAKEDVMLLQTAAEMFGNTLLRWQTSETLTTQYRYQHALAQFSRELLQNPEHEEQEEQILNKALGYLLPAVDASRAYIFRNFHVPDLGLCLGIVAEACAPSILSHLNEGNRHVPWPNSSMNVRRALEAGEAIGGPIDDVLTDAPHWVEAFQNQPNPLRSFQVFPLFLDEHWWGFVGFDDVVNPRTWSESEVRFLGTASEIITSTLQRWHGHKMLEARVRQRTADLQATNKRLRTEIGQRQRTKAILARRLEIERVLTTISSQLLQYEISIESIEAVLRELGHIVHARRMLIVYLKADDSPFDHQVIQWHRPELAPIPLDELADFRNECPWLWTQLQRGQSLHFGELATLPAEADADRSFLAERKVTSIALFPMTFDTEMRAVLLSSNFAYHGAERAQNLRILLLGANLIANMLRREAVMANLERRVVERTRELTTLFDITMLASEAKSLPELLEPAIERIAETGQCQAICVHVFSPDRQALVLTAHQGLPQSARESLSEIIISTKLSTFMGQTENQALVGELRTMGDVLPDVLNLSAYQTYFGSQLRARGEPVGLISAYRTDKRSFTLNEISLMVVLAEQLGILVENRRLQQQAGQLAVIGERQRLARELHDSITQSLYSQTLFARAGRNALEDDDAAKLHESLQQVEIGAINALKEMRLLLFQLKPAALEHMGYQDAIEQRFDDVERRLGIDAGCNVADQPDISDEVASELYRVTMEALNNSLKHADASEVRVSLQTADDIATLTIIDNGVGFDINTINPGMGLRYMRERVSHIHGHITIESSPDEGTQIIVQLPIAVIENGVTYE